MLDNDVNIYNKHGFADPRFHWNKEEGVMGEPRFPHPRN